MNASVLAEASLYLAPHVRACSTGGHVVLLDLKRNQYLGINFSEALPLYKVVKDWPALYVSHGEDESHVPDAELLEEMRQAGLLTEAPASLSSVSPGDVPPAERALLIGYEEILADIDWRDAMRFCRATLQAKYLLRSRTLEAAVNRVSQRRARISRGSQVLGDVEWSNLQRLYCSYIRLRTFLFTASNECLFDSLVLGEFLALYGVYPVWIFGVATNPFAAHCWLQLGQTVINDTPDNVRYYTPIMSV